MRVSAEQYGGHASFTLCNDSLRKLGDLASMYDCGVHMHVAEDSADVLDAEENYRTDIIHRLEELGVLRKKSIVAHGVHLNRQQLARVEKAGAWIIHNPRSNMNNAVGYAPLDWYGSMMLRWERMVSLRICPRKRSSDFSVMRNPDTG